MTTRETRDIVALYSMGFEIRVPKRLQEELKHIAPHLKIILPAAAAAVWLIRRVIRCGKREVALLTEFEAENEVRRSS